MQRIQFFSQQSRDNRKWSVLLWALALLAVTALLGAGRAQPVSANVDCAANTWSVGTGVDLSQAITCFNAKTSAGSYTLSLWGDVTLTASTPAIDNSTAGVTLLVDGKGYTITGQNTAGVRPFDVAPNTMVTMQNITLANGRGPDGGALRNRGTLTLNNVTIRNSFASDGGGGLQNNGDLTITNSTIRNNTTARSGGGILNFGMLHISDSTIAENVATFVGAGIQNEFEGTVTIEGSTIRGNDANFGSGLYNSGALSIDYSTISGNSANNNGGGIYIDNGTLAVTGSTVSNNYSFGSGGGIYADAGAFTLRSTIVANSFGQGDCVVDTDANYADGGYNLIEDATNACGLTNGVNNNIIGQDPNLGALQDNGGPTLTHALLSGSPALNAGNTSASVDQRGVARPQGGADDIGAFEVADCAGSSWTAANSGALDAAIDCFNSKTSANTYTITLTQNVTLMNSTTAIANGVAGVELLLEGSGFVVDGQAISGVRPFTINANTDVTLQNITVTSGNMPADSGGGIRVAAGGALELLNSTVRNNRAAAGGGIANSGASSVQNSTIRNNSTTGNGGGVFNEETLTITNSTVENNSVSSSISQNAGGGIFNGSGSMLNVRNSTIAGNSAFFGAGIENQGQARVDNSTFSSNTADSAGGGLRNNGGALEMYSNTVSGNAAFITGGGGVYSSGVALFFRNNIIANSVVGGDCVLVGGSLTDFGFNLIEDTANACTLTNGQMNNIVGQDPQLGPLSNNGGPTQTHALMTGSPAIDAGLSGQDSDQRGVARPFGAAADIGAFEWTPLKLYLPMVIR